MIRTNKYATLLCGDKFLFHIGSLLSRPPLDNAVQSKYLPTCCNLQMILYRKRSENAQLPGHHPPALLRLWYT
jgi:hypothetical protein